MPVDTCPKKHALKPGEINDHLAKDGWDGPELGCWTKTVGGAHWVARTVLFLDGRYGLSVTIYAAKGKQELKGQEISDLLARDGWQLTGPEAWEKDLAGVLWEALAVVFHSGRRGLNVMLATAL